ncbi:MAG: leucyl aminopeptidase [Dehalococcoidia bacterium]|tara:strand:- start:984 stop:2459 length:1476 start_codon:yes stop_codon:yes gene_type:complete
MKLNLINSEITKLENELLCVPIYEEGESKEIEIINAELDGLISELNDNGQVSSKLGSFANIYTLKKLKSKQIITFGLGKKAKLNYEKIRTVTGDLVRYINKMKIKDASIVIPGEGISTLEFNDTVDAVSQGFLLGSYKYDKYKSTKAINTLGELNLVNTSSNKFDHDFATVINECESINLVRDLINEPPNYMNPPKLEEISKSISKDSEIKLSVLNVKEMEELGMEVILGVGKGSIHDPKMIILNYEGDKSNPENNIAVIGKGITFDSGGLNLKPGMSMRTMKTDMSGSAVVLGVMNAVAHQKPKKNVMGILAVAENMPGGKAQRPGDVVKAMNGKTIEIGNTDAEGRLVLSDALSYAVDKGIKKIIDIATLTGAISIALGNEYTGLFGNDQEFINEFKNSAKQTGEKFWQLPVDQNYSKQYKDSIADIENIGGSAAGSITGAMIIGEFAGDTSWIHLDIASTITSPKDKGYNPKGPTAISVRTILNLLKN